MVTQTMIRPAILALALAVGGLAGAGAAQADTMKACSLKYQAAKKAGTLNGASWKSFRAAECGGTAAATPAATPATAAPATAAPAATPAAAPTAAAPAATPMTAPTTKMAPATAPVAAGNASFPSAVSSKYASLTPGKARMQSCLDQYNANKANGGNGGLKWIQKGGGYYSECNKRLKGG